MKRIRLTPKQAGRIEKFLFRAFGLFGLFALLWLHCPAYPEQPFWMMAIVLLPLCLITAVWLAGFSVIALPIAALVNWLTPPKP